jgi:hypothetical protein
MPKMLTKHGHSYAFVIDKPILDLLKIDPTAPVDWSTDGRSLIITPTNRARDAKFRRAVDDTVNKYSKTLKRLAE